MSIKPTTRKLPGWVHIPLFVFMSISFVQTALGFSDLFEPAFAWSFSAAITILLYGFTLFVGFRRLNQLPVGIFLVAYFAFSLFSFAGNFNAIYTSYQEEQIYRDEMTRHKQELDDVVNAANKALDTVTPDFTKERNRIESLTEQLITQITDPNRPGLGKRALELITEIEAILGEKLTELGTRDGDWKAIAGRYRENIDQIARRKLSSQKETQIQAIRENILQRQKEAEGKINEFFSGSSKDIKAQGKTIASKVVDLINKIGSETENFIKDPSIFKFERVAFESQEVNKIAYSFKSAFTEHPFIAFILAIVCFFIDWAVMLSLLVFFSGGHKEPVPVINSGRGM